MQRIMCKGKIHRATITQADLKVAFVHAHNTIIETRHGEAELAAYT